MPMPRFQFGILRLVILTAACAGVCALTMRIDAPVLFWAMITGYLLAVVIYAVLRGPYVVMKLHRHWRELREIRQRRARLETEIGRQIRSSEAIDQSINEG